MKKVLGTVVELAASAMICIAIASALAAIKLTNPRSK